VAITMAASASAPALQHCDLVVVDLTAASPRFG
jgi:hypothetical protein